MESGNNKGNLHIMGNLVSRIIIAMLWLSLPLCWLLDAPSKYTVSLTLVMGFIIYSQTCQAIIYRDLPDRNKRWPGLLAIVVFGPLEIQRLKQQQKTQQAET